MLPMPRTVHPAPDAIAIAIAVAIAVALMVQGCTRHPQSAAEVAGRGRSGAAKPSYTGYTDLVGRTVPVARPVARIILPRSKDIYLLAALLGPALPEKLIAWGPDLAKDDAEVYRRLVARFPRLGEIAVTGSVYGDGISAEQLLALRPDLIILDKFMLDRGYRYPARLEAAGLPVVYLDGSNDPFTGPQRGVRLLGEILGCPERAAAIAGFVDAQLATVLSRLAAAPPPPPPTVYLEQGYLGPDRYGDSYGTLEPAATPTSWGAILRALKVKNIADGAVARQAPLNPEYLLRADPDVIVITGQNWSNPGSLRLGCNVDRAAAVGLLRAFLTRPGWSDLAAVKNRRVCGVFHNTCSITAFAAIQALAKDCYPELFADLDPERALREFHGRFMPVGGDGTWFCRID